MLEKFQILRELVYILEIPYKATLAFQNQKLTLSDVYGRWLSMRLHLNACLTKSSFETDLTKHLIDALDNRNDVIFKNPFMNSALFLDPRYRREIIRNETKMREATENLMKIWRRISILNTENREENENPPTTANKSAEFDEKAALNSYLGIPHETENSANIDIDIEIILDNFQPKQLPMEASVIEYWESVKNEHPQLYKLAMVIFSIPPTEVQIERDFSKLDHVFTNRRCRITAERLEEIMLLNLNPDMFAAVNSEDLNELFSKLNNRY